MKNILTVLTLYVILLGASRASAQTYTLDWANSFTPAWANGALSGTATNIGSGSLINCGVTISTTGGIFALTGGGTGTQTPTVSAATFVVDASSAVNQITMDFASNTDVTTITYNFSGLISNVSFNVADIDKSNATSNTYYDQVVITASNGFTTFNPTLTKRDASDPNFLTISGNTATASTVSGQGGNSASTSADQKGTVIANFGGAVISSVTIQYKNGPGAQANPAAQAIAIGNLSFTVEPIAPPTTNNLSAPLQNSSYGPTAIPALSGTIVSGAIASYTVNTIPTAAQGVLYLCTGTCTAVTAGQVITEANKDKLRFDPAATFTGNASFTYTATSATGISGNTATYTIPVNNVPPVAHTIQARILTNTDPQDSLPPLSGGDADGTIANYVVQTLPPAGEGVLYLCTGTCTAVTAGQTISTANAMKLKFDPTAGFVGTSRFTYTAVDNNGLSSPAASVVVPVRGATTNNIPPFADNLNAEEMPNVNGQTLIPALSGRDADGTVASYTIESIPAAASGVLYYCSNGTEPCTGVMTAIAGVLSLTPAQAATLRFDPQASFAGTASFTYSATDNSGNKSNVASFTMPVYSVPPAADPVTAPAMQNSFGQTAIPALSGYSSNSITGYTIVTTTVVGSGSLYLCTPACTMVSPGTVVAPANIGKLTFDPSGLFTGNATFTYTVTDANGLVSPAATYTIPVLNTTVSANLPPTADNKVAPGMSNTNASTAIPALSGADADGTVSSYWINSLPAANQGVLYLCNGTCTAVTQGQAIAPADVANLQFDPAAGFNGKAIFTYTTRDNLGKISGSATYVIPVSNVAPRALNTQNPTVINVNSGSTALSSLQGTDADGTVSNYIIDALPPASSGVLYLCTPACSIVTAGQSIPAANAANLQFAPVASYLGLYAPFNYTAYDNSGRISNNATYYIPLGSNTLLPVQLLEFSVRRQDALAVLHWVSASEVGFKEYIVERSTDGVRFNSLAAVAAREDGQNNYFYSDGLAGLHAAAVYYRLRMTDIDGSYSFSPVLAIRLDENAAAAMSVWPNPVVNCMINVKLSSPVSATGLVQVINYDGRVIYTVSQRIVAGENVFALRVPGLVPGGYLVQAMVKGQQMNVKILVK